MQLHVCFQHSVSHRMFVIFINQILVIIALTQDMIDILLGKVVLALFQVSQKKQLSDFLMLNHIPVALNIGVMWHIKWCYGKVAKPKSFHWLYGSCTLSCDDFKCSLRFKCGVNRKSCSHILC